MSERPLELVAARAPFRDRTDAGRVLSRSLMRYRRDRSVIVLGLPRGGMAVARAVADALDAPLGVIVARKVGVPGIEDVALGAIAEGSHRVVADSVMWYLGVPARVVEKLAERESAELERCVATYRAGLPKMTLHDRTVVIVDDGLATGSTMRAALRSVRDFRPARIVTAVPVASRSSAEEVRQEVDELVAVVTPARFDTVSSAYDDYSPVTDEDVLSLLGRPNRRTTPIVRDISGKFKSALTRTDENANPLERTIALPAFDASIAADLGLPRTDPASARRSHSDGVRGLVLLAHGGGSSRNSYRNRYLAGRLRLSGYATLRLDLLTHDEEQADDERPLFRFDVDRLATRLAYACDWAEREGVPGAHRMILAGAGTSAAGALVAAARRPGRVFAVVSRGGHTDLAAQAIESVRSPVLLIVGGTDDETLRQNTAAMERLPRGAVLVRVSRSGPAFDEPGALGLVAEHTVSWLGRLEARQQSGARWHA